MGRKLLIFLALLIVISLVACRPKEESLNIVEKENRADSLLKEGNIKEAEGLYRDIISSYSASPEVYRKLASLYEGEGDLKSQEEVLLKGIEKTEYSNELRKLLIGLYKDKLKDEDRASQEILSLLEYNIGSYKFEIYAEEYGTYLNQPEFEDIIESYNGYDHDERHLAYIIRKASRNHSEENIKEVTRVLEEVKLIELSSKLQKKILNYYMANDKKEVSKILKAMSDSNKRGSIFSAYDHWITTDQGEYMIGDVLNVDISGDGYKENIILMVEDGDNEKNYKIDLQNGKTGQIYDSISGTSEYDKLTLEYPLQDDPNEHVVNLVQTNDSEDFEFIEVFFIVNRKISKPF